MSDSHGHGPVVNPFSAAEMERFHAEDRRAGAVIVCLMAAIFAIGLALYTYVCMTII